MFIEAETREEPPVFVDTTLDLSRDRQDDHTLLGFVLCSPLLLCLLFWSAHLAMLGARPENVTASIYPFATADYSPWDLMRFNRLNEGIFGAVHQDLGTPTAGGFVQIGIYVPTPTPLDGNVVMVSSTPQSVAFEPSSFTHTPISATMLEITPDNAALATNAAPIFSPTPTRINLTPTVSTITRTTAPVTPSFTSIAPPAATFTSAAPATIAFVPTPTPIPPTIATVVPVVTQTFTATASATTMAIPSSTSTATTTATIVPVVTQTFTATASTTPTATASATATSTSTPTLTSTSVPVDFAISVFTSNPTPAEGETIVITVRATNITGARINNVVVRDLLPAGLTYLSATFSSGGSYDPLTGNWRVNFAGAEFKEVYLSVLVNPGTAGASIVNTATLITADVNAADNTSSVVINVQPSVASATPTTTPSATPTSTSTPVLVDLVVSQDARDAVNYDPISSLVLGYGAEVFYYNFTVTNLSATPATNIIMIHNHNLTAGNFVPDPVDPGYASVSRTWVVGTLLPGESRTLSLRVSFPRASTSTVDNSLSVLSMDQTDANPADNSSLLSLPYIVNRMGIAFSCCSPDPVEGQAFTRRVVFFNYRATSLNGVQVSYPVPSGFSFVSATPAQGTYDPATGIWNIGTVAPATVDISFPSSVSMDITFIPGSGTGGTTTTHSAAITAAALSDPYPADNVASLDLTVQPGLPTSTPTPTAMPTATFTPVAQADIGVSVSVSNPTPIAGQVMQYTITAINYGPAPATDIRIQASVPAGLTYLSAFMTGGSSWNPFTDSIWYIPTLNSGSSLQLQVEVRVNSDTAGTNITVNAPRITSTPADPNTSNDTGSALISSQAGVGADLGLTLSASPLDPRQGDVITYEIGVSNIGPSAASGVTVDFDIPAGVTFVLSSPTVGTYNEATGMWFVDSLNVGEGGTLYVLVEVIASANSTIAASASITASSQGDPNTANNSAVSTVTVQP